MVAIAINYRKTSNIIRTLEGNKIVDNSDVVGAAPVGAAPNYIFVLSLTPGFNGLSEDNCKRIQETFKFWDLVWLMLEVLRDHALALESYATLLMMYEKFHLLMTYNLSRPPHFSGSFDSR